MAVPVGHGIKEKGTAKPASNTQRASEDRYRAKIAYDYVRWGTHCVDCYPGSCPYYVFVKDGRIVWEEVAGRVPSRSPGEPDPNPMGCQKGAAWSSQLYGPDRILYPMRRVGPRGSGKFERISWDEALNAIADAIIDAHQEQGPESVVREGTPEMAAVQAADRFVGLIGGVITDLNGSINDFAPGHHLVFGKFYPIPGNLFDAELTIIWHSNPAYTVIPFFHYLVESRYRGSEVVLVSPDVSPTHSHVDFHIPVEVGTDPALALAMCQVIVSEGLYDERFVATQTDLSLLVVCDKDGVPRYLRQSDMYKDGSDEVFYHLRSEDGELVEASRSNLLVDYRPALDGEIKVRTLDGPVVATPLFSVLSRRLEQYTPEATRSITGVHPDVVRMLARKAATKRTRILMGMGANKAYHSDLYQRTMNLLLALGGNWGKKGTGINCWAASQLDGALLMGMKTRVGQMGVEELLRALDAAEEALRSEDPTRSDELVAIEFWRRMARTGRMVPPAFFWYWHCGYRDRWNRPEWNDPAMKRAFDDYFKEALESGWWEGLARPRPEIQPRVLIECGGNILRRTRGGRRILLENLWPKLRMIVTVDFRMSATARHSDILLPAAQHYEKTGYHIPILSLVFSDKSVEPAGEAKPEWEIFSELCKALGRRARARGIDSFELPNGGVMRYDELWNRFTLDGHLTTQDRVIDEVIRDSAYAGTLPAGSDIETARRQGYIPFTGWGRMAMAKGQASPHPAEGEFVPFRFHVERGDPYPTLTRRAQFLIEHPFFVEAGEELPVHKQPPKVGGDYPLRMTTGHNRWSIHSMNMANHWLLQTHRGEPFAWVSPHDAEKRGVRDHDYIRIFNDIGSFVVRARLSPAQRPGLVTVYNGWDPLMFPGWEGPNEVEAGMVKYLGFAGGYGHLVYAPLEWQPVPTDRPMFVDFERAEVAG
jgi:DMSO reductase family type II enzyme molybdopterin subunit